MSSSLRSLRRCHGCRSSILETFAAMAGLSIHSKSTFNPRKIERSAQHRHFTTSRTLSSSESLLSSETASEPPPPPPPSTKIAIPWYLRVEPPTPIATAPLPSTPDQPNPEIPALPTNSPPILSPILHTLYQTLGLDSLTLLDLRHLTSPPPALGSNLVMILATARSTKHLNVSADRFCRWCRATYRLRPYADGLLGRNELKLKLRRKARRQRLAASVGNTVSDSRGLGADDGITTGWICVNLGPVDEVDEAASREDVNEVLAEEEEEHKEYKNPVEQGSEFAGFGSRSTAPRIVVQMFTEEKRAEMDLEGLWGVRQSRREKKESAITVAWPTEVEADEAQTEVEADEAQAGEVDEAQARGDGGVWRGASKDQKT